MIRFITKQPQGFKEFLFKLGLFSILFILVTGILGPWIIGTKLLYGFYFFIYPNMGKMILFSAIAFIILTRNSINTLKHVPYKGSNVLFVVLAFTLIPVFFTVAQVLLQKESFLSNLFLALGAHLLAVSIPILLVIGVFGWQFIMYFVTKFKKEVGICLALSVFFYFAIFQVWKLWPIFSGIVLHSVAFLLSLHVSPVMQVGYLTLFVEDFAVRIEQACSGLDSMFLFTCLYILIALVDWQKFHKAKLIGLYFFALIGLFAVNILRVYMLILVGIYVDPKLTLQLFHTYLGMVLFMIYFFIFWFTSYNWLKK
ncbi:MAG TPA: archaeosortase/exosortase family protein [Candidatus Woesebacteria bacterium]|nr:archaeosortase/exosortase family protein [Candidatus Woesebacteria bacterium]